LKFENDKYYKTKLFSKIDKYYKTEGVVIIVTNAKRNLYSNQ